MKVLFLSLGFISFSLGVIGLVLPVLPTTPFLLLATLMFSKSSHKVNNWLKESKIYQRHFSDFLETQTMSKKKKWILLIIVDLILLAVFVSLDSTVLRIILFVLFIFKHWYFMRFVKTY